MHPILLREVNLSNDAQALYEMYMSKDVIPFMTFEEQTFEEFSSSTLPSMQRGDNKLFVLEVDSTVVAARKVRIGKGPYAHVAYLSSFVVHPDHRRKGYAQVFFQELQTLLGNDIKRIEISQEVDNIPAYSLATEKQNFIHEYTMTDWLIRSTGTHQEKWYVAERFLAYFPDDTVQPTKSGESPCGEINFEAMQYADDALRQNKYRAARNNDQIIITDEENNIVAKANVSTGSKRYNHIAFLDNLELMNKTPEKNTQRLVILTLEVLKQYKRIELAVPNSNQTLIQALLSTGFCFQGQRHFGYKNTNNELEHEYAFSISAFNLNDARSALEKTKADEESLNKLEATMSAKPTAASQLQSILLENCAYQQIMLEQNLYPTNEVNQDYLNTLSTQATDPIPTP